MKKDALTSPDFAVLRRDDEVVYRQLVMSHATPLDSLERILSLLAELPNFQHSHRVGRDETGFAGPVPFRLTATLVATTEDRKVGESLDRARVGFKRGQERERVLRDRGRRGGSSLRFLDFLLTSRCGTLSDRCADGSGSGRSEVRIVDGVEGRKVPYPQILV